jgi:hypothetical protein
MDKHTSAPSRVGWRWILVLIGGAAWLSVGCSPQSLSALLLPFADTSLPPEYQLFSSDKEITLAIVSNFNKLETNAQIQTANVELAELLADIMRKRCTDNKNKIKIIPDAQVRSQESKLRQLNGGDPTPLEIGAKLKADYVLDLAINSMSLYEKITYPPMYHGKTNLMLTLYKVDAKEGEHKVFGKEFMRVHPRDTGAIDSTAMNPSMYRTVFLMHVADDISMMFLSYPPEDRKKLE